MKSFAGSVLQAVQECTALPTLPKIAIEVVQLARRRDVDMRQLAALISNDPALSSKILKTVNSSYYGLGRKISTISQALTMLGLQSLKTLALSFSLVNALGQTRPATFDYMSYWRRSIYSALSARVLAETLEMKESEEAFLAGLLQDIGMLVLDTVLPQQYGTVHGQAGRHAALADVEQEHFQTDHAQAGQLLAEKWSFPSMLSVPVGFHHRPDQAPSELRPLTQVVALAGCYAEVFMSGRPADAISTAYQKTRQWFQMDSHRVDAMLEHIGQSVQSVADMFEVNIGQTTDYPSLLAQANEVLLDLSLQSQQLASQLEHRNEELRHAVATDALTGVSNRSHVEQRLAEEFSRARRFYRPLSVLFIDADRFKRINDTHGHSAGDAVLSTMARVLQRNIGSGDLLGRFGGEEFVCVLTETKVGSAERLANTIRQSIEREDFRFQGKRIAVTVSIGVAGISAAESCESPEMLLQRADRAMYAAKRDGRNLVRLFSPSAPVIH